MLKIIQEISTNEDFDHESWRLHRKTGL